MKNSIISKEPVLTLKNKKDVKLVIELVDVYLFKNTLILKEYISYKDENDKEQFELYKNNYSRTYSDDEFNKLMEYTQLDFKTKNYIDNFNEMFNFILLFVNQIDPPYNLKINSFIKN